MSKEAVSIPELQPAILTRETKLDAPTTPRIFAERAKTCHTADEACALIDETLRSNGFGVGADELAWLLRKTPDVG